MKSLSKSILLVSGLLLGLSSYAAAPAGAPAGATGLCKDDTYYTGAKKQGACRGHKGVKDWYGDTASATPAAAAASTPAPATTAPAAASAAAPKSSAPKSTMPATAAAGGGPGLVWVNASSKVYHCQNDKWYGKTKQGQYMSEADAKAKGYHGDHGKSCQ